ncbi:phosphohydrolase [Methylomonas koyamae]|uniref:Phosphohydrolase n=1 Tax=Methylomonas koyamae TaxID=702114 RepID=A0A177NPF4_9GAMM|nr:HD domain-containing protein [Methylomonas koyamae]OAI19722.1 phosphohydrolase [Methylomonas koyamae]
MSKLSEAFALAHEFHATQLRKSTNIPYISHLMSVSALVMEHGGDQEQAIAALLHDAVEDADTTDEANSRRAIIRAAFGERVAAIVDGCTDGVPDSNGVKPDWHTRKRAYLAHLEHSHADTLLVSCADKLHNARAILIDYRSIGNEVFGRFNAGKDGTLWYYQELARIFDARLPGALSAELSRTVSNLSIVV